MNFLVDAEAAKDKKEAKMNKAQADWLLESIIPKHVIAELQEEKLYSRNYENVGVIFASIVNFGDFYEENFEGGKECIRVLNELVGDFDDLLQKLEFSEVEKIKTVNGSTFMAASGLNNSQGNGKGKNHLKQLIEFALAMMQEISNFNDHMLGFKFILRVGFNAGPVTAGVIGTNKLFYDIWGDTVNIASRMDSTGVDGRVQVSEASKNLLEEFFAFEERGEIPVKGKGTIKTFLLVGPVDDKIDVEVKFYINF
jgi:adenylate cyclase 9